MSINVDKAANFAQQVCGELKDLLIYSYISGVKQDMDQTVLDQKVHEFFMRVAKEYIQELVSAQIQTKTAIISEMARFMMQHSNATISDVVKHLDKW